MPQNANQLEYSAWKEHCRCDVSQFILHNTEHAFTASTTLPQWMHHVVTWVQSKGATLAPRPAQTVADRYAPEAWAAVKLSCPDVAS